MAYFIEFAQQYGEAFYQEFAIFGIDTGYPILGDFIDHQLRIYRGQRDYGQWLLSGQTIASNSNGLITIPQPGVIVVDIPPSAFPCFGGLSDSCWYDAGDRCAQPEVLRFRLLAVPANPDFTKCLANGTISFGDRMMPNPRIQLGVYPQYPNSPTAYATAQVAQIKQQLIAMGDLDLVEAALTGGPTDPATLSWNLGSSVSIGGPLCNVIAATLGYDLNAMAQFMAASAARVV